jgi:hypothetical protein
MMKYFETLVWIAACIAACAAAYAYMTRPG